LRSFNLEQLRRFCSDRIMRTGDGAELPRSTSPLKLILLWLFIIACFSAFGFVQPEYRPHRNVMESLVAFAAIGVGAASYLVVGICIISRVRRRKLKGIWAFLLLLVCCILVILVPYFITMAVAHLTRSSPEGLFQGEHAWWLIIVSEYMFYSALSVFLICLVFMVPMKTQVADA